MSDVRHWTVGGGVVESEGRLLLVRNLRRTGHEDWSTPGGVIDPTDASLVEGLTREVEEETGIHVERWSGPIYEVVAHAQDMRWRMRCEVYVASEFVGDIVVDDPDGIVVEAAFVPVEECAGRLATCPPWVREPLGEWLTHRWSPAQARTFSYDVFGTERAALRVVRRTTGRVR